MTDAPELRPVILALLDSGLYTDRGEILAADLIRVAYNLGLAHGQARQADTLPDVYALRDARALPEPDYRERREYRAPVVIGGWHGR